MAEGKLITNHESKILQMKDEVNEVKKTKNWDFGAEDDDLSIEAKGESFVIFNNTIMTSNTEYKIEDEGVLAFQRLMSQATIPELNEDPLKMENFYSGTFKDIDVVKESIKNIVDGPAVKLEAESEWDDEEDEEEIVETDKLEPLDILTGSHLRSQVVLTWECVIMHTNLLKN